MVPCESGAFGSRRNRASAVVHVNQKNVALTDLWVLRQGLSDPIQAGCVWSAKKSGLGGLLHGPKECYFEGFVGFEARAV